ncbi:MAG: pyridoxamine 5'-phosphate oxidase [Actinomycetota bacterium]|nr:pyridoxamine 5'-phosphate oxidase [Actinomycetota bacterium]
MSSSGTPPGDQAAGIAGLRVSYETGALDEDGLAATPLEQFRAWFDEAVEVGLAEPNAMVVATASVDGQPSARTVLLKEADARGFVFFTNLGSRKATELHDNPRASLVFPWFAMHRQIVAVGQAELLPRDEVAAYFGSRPHSSRLGAWASRQSAVLAGRADLERRYADLADQHPPGSDVPVPPFWGGWLVRPDTVEFWQGRASRLHDRLRYRARVTGAAASVPARLDRADDWVIERLSP